MSLIKSFQSAVEIQMARGWEYMYIAVDVHGTILKPNYKKDEIPTEFYPHAEKVMKLLSDMTGVKLIMYTSSTPDDCIKYDNYFKTKGIMFDFINENPDVPSEGFGYFEKKPYFNLLLDDKASFDAEPEEENDWSVLRGLIFKETTVNLEFYRKNFYKRENK